MLRKEKKIALLKFQFSTNNFLKRNFPSYENLEERMTAYKYLIFKS